MQHCRKLVATNQVIENCTLNSFSELEWCRQKPNMDFGLQELVFKTQQLQVVDSKTATD
jgi:hypothetical protein